MIPRRWQSAADPGTYTPMPLDETSLSQPVRLAAPQTDAGKHKQSVSQHHQTSNTDQCVLSAIDLAARHELAQQTDLNDDRVRQRRGKSQVL